MTKKISAKSENFNSKIRVKDYKETGITTKFLGTREVIDAHTGERLELEYIEKQVSHSLKGGWRRVYMENFMQIIGGLYAQARKIQIVEFILDNLNSENQLTMTQTQVIQKTGASPRIVVDTYKYLVNSGFMRKVGAVYVVSPDFVCAIGSDKKNARILLEIKEEADRNLPQFEASSPETA